MTTGWVETGHTWFSLFYNALIKGQSCELWCSITIFIAVFKCPFFLKYFWCLLAVSDSLSSFFCLCLLHFKDVCFVFHVFRTLMCFVHWRVLCVNLSCVDVFRVLMCLVCCNVWFVGVVLVLMCFMCLMHWCVCLCVHMLMCFLIPGRYAGYFYSRHVHKPLKLCDYDIKSSTNTHILDTHFQNITNNIFDFGRPFFAPYLFTHPVIFHNIFHPSK